MKNPGIPLLFFKKMYQIDQNARNITEPFITITRTLLLSLLILDSVWIKDLPMIYYLIRDNEFI